MCCMSAHVHCENQRGRLEITAMRVLRVIPFFLLCLYLSQVTSQSTFRLPQQHPDVGLSTPDMIARRGYPVETHPVTTKDGYILNMHRIPAPGRPVVFLQHGFLCSSADWVLMGPENGLGYILYDAGYDVWMGNARGNEYSNRHISLTMKKSNYWDFTWNEMGMYDIPAEIDYVLAHTDQEQLAYVGHSMGTTMFWVMCSLRPEYNAKIKIMFALSPVAFMGRVRTPAMTFLAPFIDQFEWARNMLGMNEFLPSNEVMNFMGLALCQDGAITQALCTSALFLVCGFNSKQLNQTSLPVILDHTPAGASTKTFVHFVQGVRSERFCQYNYGLLRNMQLYGSTTPPSYDLSKVTAPVYLHYSDNDWLSDVNDVAVLSSKLGNVKGKYRVLLESFNHLDFLWAIDVRSLLYDNVLSLLSSSF